MVLGFFKKSCEEETLCCIFQQNTNFGRRVLFTLKHQRERLKNWACPICDLFGDESRMLVEEHMRTNLHSLFFEHIGTENLSTHLRSAA